MIRTGRFGAPFSLRRWGTYLLVTFLLYVVLILGALTPLSEEDIKSKYELLRDLVERVKSPIDIFVNNLVVALLMYLPLLGTALGSFVIYNSGQVIASYALTQGYDIGMAILAPLLTGFGVLEFIGYGISVTEGVLLFYSALKKGLKRELYNVPVALFLTVMFLLIAAYIEFWLLNLAP